MNPTKIFAKFLTLGLAGLMLMAPTVLADSNIKDQRVIEGDIVDVGVPSYCVYYWYSVGDWTVYVGNHHVYIAQVAQGSGKVCPLGSTIPDLVELEALALA
jgi:hypothetical protein